MPRTATRTLPLRQMRETAGKSYEQVATEMTVLLGRDISPQYVRLLEYRGTGLYDLINAFAQVYDQPPDSVAMAAKPV